MLQVYLVNYAIQQFHHFIICNVHLILNYLDPSCEHDLLNRCSLQFYSSSRNFLSQVVYIFFSIPLKLFEVYCLQSTIMPFHLNDQSFMNSYSFKLIRSNYPISWVISAFNYYPISTIPIIRSYFFLLTVHPLIHVLNLLMFFLNYPYQLTINSPFLSIPRFSDFSR